MMAWKSELTAAVLLEDEKACRWWWWGSSDTRSPEISVEECGDGDKRVVPVGFHHPPKPPEEVRMSSDSAENNNSQDTAVVPSSLIEDGKNRTKIHCPYCPSLMLSAGKASYVQKEFFLPHTRKITESCGQEEGDSLSDYWVVDSMYTFENVSFSLRVGSVHYLACGDCERGPIGWHDINDSSSFYIALDRVKHS